MVFHRRPITWYCFVLIDKRRSRRRLIKINRFRRKPTPRETTPYNMSATCHRGQKQCPKYRAARCLPPFRR